MYSNQVEIPSATVQLEKTKLVELAALRNPAKAVKETPAWQPPLPRYLECDCCWNGCTNEPGQLIRITHQNAKLCVSNLTRKKRQLM